VARLLAAADIVALASQSEGLANVWVEALACGTPVVAPPIDGAPEAIDRPAAGRAGAGDTAGLCRSHQRAAGRTARAAETRAIAEAKFAWPRHVRELKAHLAAVAATRPC
jgi:Glycosyltransferase